MNIYDEEYNKIISEKRVELERIDNKIAERERQIERLKKKRDKVWISYSWLKNVVGRLMADLEKATGLKGEIYGPFGLRAATSIYLREDMSKSICDQDTLSIELEHREGETYYHTGEYTHEYAFGTIGEMNGFNHVMAPLPDTLEEIIKVLEKHNTEEAI